MYVLSVTFLRFYINTKITIVYERKQKVLDSISKTTIYFRKTMQSNHMSGDMDTRGGLSSARK